MITIEEIVYKNTEGEDISYNSIHSLIEELKALQILNLEEGVFYMLNYCLENVGSSEVNTKEEFRKWLKSKELC